jgi:diketogulonate reductase-like aldo/keto reductase
VRIVPSRALLKLADVRYCTVYGNQDSVGAAIRNSGLERSDLYVTSKWGYGDPEYALRESLKQVCSIRCELELL